MVPVHVKNRVKESQLTVKHRGRLEPGHSGHKGTIFTLTLPYNECQWDEAAHRAHAGAPKLFWQILLLKHVLGGQDKLFHCKKQADLQYHEQNESDVSSTSRHVTRLSCIHIILQSGEQLLNQIVKPQLDYLPIPYYKMVI